MLEHEAKLLVDEDFTLPDLSEVLAELRASVVVRSERTINDVYYDTADLRLLRWGSTLRHRKDDGWIVKLPVGANDKSLTRHEVNLGGRAGTPPIEALRLVAPFARAEPLVEVATITTRRTVRPVCTTDGGSLAELADDNVTSRMADGRTSTFRQLEVELAPGAETSILEPILAALTEAGARLQPSGIKLAIGLGRPRLKGDISVPVLPDSPSARQVIRRAIARSVEQLILQLPIARLGQDPRGIHQARVATRRLRSDLRTFKPLLDPTSTTDLQPRLRVLAAHLGQVRDTDVLHDLLENTLPSHPEIDPSAGEELIAVVVSQRRTALAALDTYLDEPGAIALLEDLVAAASDPPTTVEAGEQAEVRLPELVVRRWRRLDRAINDLDPDPPAPALHEIRILTKQTRYATEAIAPAFGIGTQLFAKSLAALQETLGELNDAAMAGQWLTRIARNLDPAAASAANQLTRIFHQTTTGTTDWRDSWDEIRNRQPDWLN